MLSVVALYRSSLKDRELQVHEQSTRVREAAGSTLAKVDRLHLLSLSVFDDLQPLFVDVSNAFGRNRDFAETRDQLWKGVNDIKLKHQHRILDEEIETGYVALVAFDPEVRATFRRSLRQRSDLEDAMFNSLLIEGERIVFSFEGRRSYTSAQMGNEFRDMASAVRKDYEPSVAATLEPLQLFLLDLLTRSDAEIAAKSRGARRG